MRHFVGRSLVGGLCVAAFVACVALATGDFGDGHWKVIGTSLGFSVFSAFAGSGDALRARGRGNVKPVGIATIAVSVAAFVALLVALWADPEGEATWQTWGVLGVLSLCGSHASLVLRAKRGDDTPTVTALVATSLVTAGIDTVLAVVAISGLYDDFEEGWARFAGVVLVLLVLSTVLPPLLRKFATPSSDVTGRAEPQRPPLTLRALADEVADVADRLERIDGARGEAANLRDLADRARN